MLEKMKLSINKNQNVPALIEEVKEEEDLHSSPLILPIEEQGA